MRAPLLLGLIALTGCNFLRGYAEGQSVALPAYTHLPHRGFYRLLFDDFRGLNSDAMQRSAVPWKLLVAGSLRVEQHSNASIELTEAAFVRLMSARYGFVVPARVANWPDGAPQPAFARPMGIVSGMVQRSIPAVSIETANLGCSTCHSASLYDSEGNPTREVWIGLPSSSINAEGFAVGAYQALKWSARNPESALTTVRLVFPHVSEAEIDSLRKYYLPDLAKKVATLEATIRRFTPYSNGGPGLTNGAATLQYYMGWLGGDTFHREQAAFTAVPELGALRLRKSVLSDGVYAPPDWEHYGPLSDPGSAAHRDGMAGVICIVTVGTLGVEPGMAVTNRERMRDVIDYVFDAYRPPPFPGRIDETLAEAGEQVFASHCGSCHGRYVKVGDAYRIENFPNLKVQQARMGTDPVRWEIVSSDLVSKFQRTPLAMLADARRSPGYVAPPLTGIWATAPYLHNGSVPTLWHLMHPDQRPKRFMVGGHKLDLTRVGIAGEVGADGVYRYPPDYGPWTLPEIYDTNSLGRSAAGHEVQFEKLREDDKRALLEFLKRL